MPCPGPVARTFQSYPGRNWSNVAVISVGSENVFPSSSDRVWKHRMYSTQYRQWTAPDGASGIITTLFTVTVPGVPDFRATAAGFLTNFRSGTGNFTAGPQVAPPSVDRRTSGSMAAQSDRVFRASQ